MKRILTIAIVVGLLMFPAPAFAGGTGGTQHGSDIVQGAAYEGTTEASIFAEGGQVHYIVSRQRRCWYPQNWLDDAITNGEDSPYYEYAAAVAFDPDWFSPDVRRVGGDSCIQQIYYGSGSCTDDQIIGVSSIDALWGVHSGTIGSFGEIGLHEYPNRYCIEIIDIDRWRKTIADGDFIPKPVRATFPRYRTLVGLENRIWYEVEAGADRYVDGFYLELPTPGTTYNINVNIWLAEIAIDIDGDGDWDHTVTCSTGAIDSLTDCGGSSEDPIFTFGYEQRAFHHFIIESRWAGEAIDESGTVHILDPDFLAVQHTFDWETVEVRSSLDG